MSRSRPPVVAALACGLAAALAGAPGPAVACGVGGDTYTLDALWPLVGEEDVPSNATLIVFGHWALGEGGCSPVEVYLTHDGRPVVGGPVVRGFSDETLFRPDRPLERGGHYEVTFEVDPARDGVQGTPGAVQVRSRFTVGRGREDPPGRPGLAEPVAQTWVDGGTGELNLEAAGFIKLPWADGHRGMRVWLSAGFSPDQADAAADRFFEDSRPDTRLTDDDSPIPVKLNRVMPVDAPFDGKLCLVPWVESPERRRNRGEPFCVGVDQPPPPPDAPDAAVKPPPKPEPDAGPPDLDAGRPDFDRGRPPPEPEPTPPDAFAPWPPAGEDAGPIWINPTAPPSAVTIHGGRTCTASPGRAGAGAPLALAALAVVGWRGRRRRP